jgi:putative endopeptidase
MQHQIYEQMASLPKVKYSGFARNLHAPTRALSKHCETVYAILQQISNLMSVRDIPNMMSLLNQNGCIVGFTLHANPDFKGPNEILYFEECAPKSFGVDYIEWLCSAFGVPFGVPPFSRAKIAQMNRFEKDLCKHAYSFIQKKDVKLVYNPVSPQNHAWIKHFFGAGNCPQRISLDNFRTYQTISDSLVDENLEMWKSLLLVAWMDHCAALFHNTFKEYKVQHSDEHLTTRLHLVQLACASWWQDAGHQYVTHFVDDRCFAICEILIDLVFRGFWERISSSEMSNSTKQAALEKLLKMKFHIGRTNHELPPVLDWSAPTSFDEAYFEGFRYQFARTLARCDQVPNPRQWREMGFHIVNAYYITECNAVFIPAAIISNLHTCSSLKVFADHVRVIAHETMHGFDSQARLVNADGQIHNWWTASDNEHYESNKRKLAKLYQKQHVDPVLTMAENVADVVSLQIAYYAWVKPEHTNEEKREFFIEYARSQICKTTPAFAKDAHETDTHATAAARTNVPVSCMVEFRELFDVRPTDKLYVSRGGTPHFL